MAKGNTMRLQVTTMVGAICALIFMGSSDATAQQIDYERVSREVRYGDLDLHSEAGANAMLVRLHRASEYVCGYEGYSRNWDARRQARLCARQAMSRAVAASGSETLRAEYANWRSGGGGLLFSRTIEIAADQSSARVRYSDLNLASTSGQDVLVRRVARATRQICGSGSRGLQSTAQQRACVETASEDARVQIASVMSRQQLALTSAPAIVVTEAPATVQTVAATGSAAETPAAQTLAVPTPTPADDGFGVCATRMHAAAFHGRSVVLDRAQSQQIGYVVDSASVCQLERVVIAARRGDVLALRRASALRASVIGRGVPANLVAVEVVDHESADGAHAEFQFAGVAQNAAPGEMAAAGA